MATRPIKKFKAGTSVILRIEVRDAQLDTTPLSSPAAGVQILLRDSTGVEVINYGGMVEEETGVFTYSYQTSATTSPLGVWRTTFRAVSGSLTVNTVEVDAFELVQ